MLDTREVGNTEYFKLDRKITDCLLQAREIDLSNNYLYDIEYSVSKKNLRNVT